MIAVNQQINLDSFLWLKIETVSHELAGIKYFPKTDLKLAYD